VMPQTQEEVVKVKEILSNYFGVEDDPAVWMNVMGEFTSTNRSTMRKSYRKLAIVGKRVIINKVCHDLQVVESKKLQDKLKAKIEEMQRNEESGVGGLDNN